MTIRKTVLAAGVLLVVGCGIAGVVIAMRETAPQTPPPLQASAAVDEAVNQTPVAAERLPEILPAPVAEMPPAQTAAVQATGDLTVASAPAPARRAPSAQTPRSPATRSGDAVIPLPLAREALKLVGSDPAAEAIWTQAINDPNLSTHARQDLIEDLNEEGFADPRKVTKEELPLIVNRLAIIERLAPSAMDEVNAAAFREAHKDLMDMFMRLNQPL